LQTTDFLSADICMKFGWSRAGEAYQKFFLIGFVLISLTPLAKAGWVRTHGLTAPVPPTTAISLFHTVNK